MHHPTTRHAHSEEPRGRIIHRDLPSVDIDERGACAIIAFVKKDGRPSHGNVQRTLNALARMSHRTGEAANEGDGAGIQTDIPRVLWARRFEAAGLPPEYAQKPALIHFLVPVEHAKESEAIRARLRDLIVAGGLDVILEHRTRTNRSALGPVARIEEPEFWQWMCLPRSDASKAAVTDSQTFRLQVEIERALPVHILSFSRNTVIYKVRGTPDVLRAYFPDLRNPEFMSAITLGHGRFSTNTRASVTRAQMCSTLGHNGEINTIQSLVRTALHLGIPLPGAGSDSQMVDRAIEALMFEHGFTLMEAMEILFPPVPSEAALLPEGFAPLYAMYHRAFGSLAQGPAAIIARQGDEVVFSVDALGLRPLWFGETDREYFAGSERGVLPLDQMTESPRPLAPGEKMGFVLDRGDADRPVRVYDHATMRQLNLLLGTARWNLPRPEAELRSAGGFSAPEPPMGNDLAGGTVLPVVEPIPQAVLATLGWSREDVESLESLIDAGTEPVSSLGHDGPLAVLSEIPRNLSDYLHEKVAVVTNPAIDRLREAEHFSTVCYLGARPSLKTESRASTQLRLDVPLILGGRAGHESLHRALAREFGTVTLEELKTGNHGLTVATLRTSFTEGEALRGAVERLADEALAAVTGGATVIVLRDGFGTDDWSARYPIDPLLAVAWLERALSTKFTESGESLRRRVSLVVSSASIRNVHDFAMAIGFGADAVHPVAVYDQTLAYDLPLTAEMALRQLVKGLSAGLEKVLSTMGIHQVEGYSRICAAIGLNDELETLLGVPNYCGDATRGLSLDAMEKSIRERMDALRGPNDKAKPKFPSEGRILPRVRRALESAATGAISYREYAAKIRLTERERPNMIRHLMTFEVSEELLGTTETPVAKRARVGTGVHRAPIYFSAMSLGSQGETSFRAYAEGAHRLGIFSINGEGGELEDLIGKYSTSRGQQIASGRFGVNIELLNSCDLLEIKIGQGAKPGEGGHLPAKKVTPLIARTRHTPVGIDLLSPSNNHDIYSIEDLAQLIEELKTANPRATVSVKLPAVPGIGTIAVGVAKARADVITVSGFEGGTGAARRHALRYAGLPVEIGVKEVHAALVRSGLRDQVRVWADGGMRSAEDVVKLMLLGADRVGFGTLAMMAIGCITCKSCHTGKCPTGITTFIKDTTTAKALGIDRFVPREYDHAVEHLVHFFDGLIRHFEELVAGMGFASSAELVGRSDLLIPMPHAREVLALDWLLEIPHAVKQEAERDPDQLGIVRVGRSVTSLTRSITEIAEEQADQGAKVLLFTDRKLFNTDRVVGTHLSGARARHRDRASGLSRLSRIQLHFHENAMAGNGLAAFLGQGMSVIIEGGAEAGVGKGLSGGRVYVLKSENHRGRRIGGSVGKCCGYGAQSGLIVVQGDADTRAGVRLSGADLIIGGLPTGPVLDEAGSIGSRSNIKGFGFEYMTSGRGLVLGDPGPWLCSGMSGGVVYLRLDYSVGLTEDALRRRLARGAKVTLTAVGSDEDERNLLELLAAYREILDWSEQTEEADFVGRLETAWRESFVKVVPVPPLKDDLLAFENELNFESPEEEEEAFTLFGR